MSYDSEGNYIIDPQAMMLGEADDFDEYYDPDDEWESAGFSIEIPELDDDEVDLEALILEEGAAWPEE